MFTCLKLKMSEGNMEEKKENEKYMPWKSGIWYTKRSSSWIMIVKGDVHETKSLCALDYPDARAMATTTWSYATTLEEFQFYCCPECDIRDHSRESFVKHALKKHPLSIKCLGSLLIKTWQH